jgi:hypothetical protein
MGYTQYYVTKSLENHALVMNKVKKAKAKRYIGQSATGNMKATVP